ncbi:hypothetical protein NDU88_006830 [Pleurodeles waltl]|uniref:Uncharacterized protein n=1 Tax=Pleurodeles waltl TaxID=8319 RepID=A0AAV7RQ28_PLEWA|nr:hypothetical protein NDU88_006830 [Pleurodeles waltl]
MCDTDSSGACKAHCKWAKRTVPRDSRTTQTGGVLGADTVHTKPTASLKMEEEVVREAKAPAEIPPVLMDQGLKAHTATILAATIKDTKESLKKRIKTVAHDVNLPREDHKK